MGELDRDPTAAAEWGSRFLIMDELNQFSAMTSSYWRAHKPSGAGNNAPIWERFASVLWMGRALKCHVIVVGQRLDERSTGNIGLRDSFGFRGLAGFRPNQWMMLVGAPPIPRSQKPRGRWIYTDGQTETARRSRVPGVGRCGWDHGFARGR